MKFLAGVLSFLCAVLFLATGVSALCAFNAESKLAAAAPVKTALDEQGFYVHLPAIFAQEIHVQVRGADPATNSLAAVTTDRLTDFLTAMLPPPEVKQTFEAATDQTFAFLRGEGATATISFDPLKQYMRTHAVDALMAGNAANPECTPEQLAALDTSIMFICKPPEVSRAGLQGRAEKAVEAFVDLFPDTTTYPRARPTYETDAWDQLSTSPTRQSIQHRFIHDQRFRAEIFQGMRWSPAVPAVLLLLIALFSVRTNKALMLWWGIPVFLLGLMGAVIGGAGVWASADQLGPYLSGAITEGETTISSQAYSAVAVTLAKGYANAILIQSGVIAVIGLIMVIAGFSIRRPLDTDLWPVTN